MLRLLIVTFFASVFFPTHTHAQRLQYPVILVHGLLSGDSVASMKNAAKELRQHGTKVYLAEVLAAGSIAARADDLADYVDAVLKHSQALKVNIVAHSMGGLDSRYLVSKLGYGNKVASLTTISTPHRGAIFADEVLKELNSGRRTGIIRFIEILSTLYNDQTTLQNVNLRQALLDLSKAEMNKFNQSVSNDNRVIYLSFSSIASKNNMHAVLRPVSEIVFNLEGTNDGLVESSSAEWGEFMGTANCDHFSIGGMGRSKFRRQCDFKNFYRDLVQELSSRNL